MEPEALLTHGALPPKNNTRPLDPQFKAGSSPKALGKYGSNSRSFTCLLKEIDEEEEKNFKASLPQETERYPAQTKRDTEDQQPRKSRNGNVPKLNSQTNGHKASSTSIASSNKVQQ